MAEGSIPRSWIGSKVWLHTEADPMGRGLDVILLDVAPEGVAVHYSAPEGDDPEKVPREEFFPWTSIYRLRKYENS